jgi:hypothetical protein
MLATCVTSIRTMTLDEKRGPVMLATCVTLRSTMSCVHEAFFGSRHFVCAHSPSLRFTASLSPNCQNRAIEYHLLEHTGTQAGPPYRGRAGPPVGAIDQFIPIRNFDDLIIATTRSPTGEMDFPHHTSQGRPTQISIFSHSDGNPDRHVGERH